MVPCGTADGVLQDLCVHYVGSGIRLQASETGHRAWKQQDQAEHASMGNVLMNRQTFLLWAGNTDLQMLNSWETSQTSAWEIRSHEI